MIGMKLIFVSLFSLSVAFAQTESEESSSSYLNEQDIEKMMRKVEALKSSDVAEFPKMFRVIETEVLEFLQFKKKQCKGEFSSVQLDEYGEETLVKMKLSKKEREMCYREVKSFMRHYLEKAYTVKEQFLKRLLKTELNALEEAKKKQLERIESLI